MNTPVTYKYYTREEWLAMRNSGIGASEVAAALGANQYKSALTLWAEKTNQVPPQEETRRLRVSLKMEPIIVEEFALETGMSIIDPHNHAPIDSYAVYQNPDTPFLFATPDRLLPDNGVLELKSSGDFMRPEWNSDDPPLMYQCQVQAQMYCCGADYAILCALVGNSELFHFRFERNDRFISAMLTGVSDFWNCVQTMTPPNVDGSESTTRTIAKLHPLDTGEIVQLPIEAIENAAKLNELSEQIKKAEADADAIKNWLRIKIGDASFGECGAVKYSYKAQTRKGKVEVDPVLIPQLESAGIEYTTKDDSTFRVLRQMKGK